MYVSTIGNDSWSGMLRQPNQQKTDGPFATLEAARDASVRTASEAGDGTTTATILADSLVRGIFAYVESNPKVSPQQVVRTLEKTHRDILEPLLKQISRKVDTSTEDGLKTLAEVATISANGDQELAQAVMKCFEICGDEGNVTISEVSGPSSFEVEHVKGYPIPMGYEESCGKMYPKFVNSIRTQQCILEN
ncbi:MAG: TCP-1/cpn60 chaperonin family protein, partial [Ginsengibacter sp.]